ncbi:YidC/Oxa1 family membrane protein insertase [Halonatronum saccharophilum]|uniref:YidC/Oxa1 family membrane protein insertase n=1 Tax=Halonatronum saccharophilum TaxID=150060 RepID=UPI0004B526A9|nr:YidC/Oxa1 family membrane protein insertase [Halonatronum saccharophilum]
MNTKRKFSFFIFLGLILILTGCSTDFRVDVIEGNESTILVESDKQTYERGDIVTLVAQPEETFEHWDLFTDEDEYIKDNPVEFEIDQGNRAKAFFTNDEAEIRVAQDTSGGMFGWIGNIMQDLLSIIYNFTGSYGLSIILLTVIVRLILGPLNAKQTRSMKKMQKLQPMIEELKKKHGDDQEKLQQEMMKLYQKHKVNPAAGCLPMIVQMPIIIALFRALQNWPELYGESFLFISDLSESNIVLIILTGIVMLGQSIMTQQMSGSGSSNKAALFMPLFIVVIGFGLPAGVLLYWMTSTLIMAIQQYFLYKESDVELKEESN